MPIVFVGSSASMRQLMATIGDVAWSDTPVLIQGETGTGKEVIARQLHMLSPRAAGPFVKINCAALPSELIESELFGYERGAFTGAAQRKQGIFELAHLGTILLDEIGDMDVRLQARLLQVLQDQEFRRVGGRDLIRVDVRVISATHRDLDAEIAAGSFRQDLLYRLNVISLNIPPLRDRREDIVPLAEFLMTRHAMPGMRFPAMSAALQKTLLEYHWPGNVRELENMMRKLLVLGDSESIISELQAKASRIVPHLVHPAPHATPSASNGNGNGNGNGKPHYTSLSEVTSALEQEEMAAIVSALNAVHWNRKRAAALLNVNYKGLLYRMHKLGIAEAEEPIAMPQPCK